MYSQDQFSSFFRLLESEYHAFTDKLDAAQDTAARNPKDSYGRVECLRNEARQKNIEMYMLIREARTYGLKTENEFRIVLQNRGFLSDFKKIHICWDVDNPTRRELNTVRNYRIISIPGSHD